MTGRLGLGIMLAVALTACGSPPATPTPQPTPAASWDPRRDEIDQAQAVWEHAQPGTYAYTFRHAGPAGLPWDYDYRVTALDGQLGMQQLGGVVQPDTDQVRMSVEGLFDVARTALASRDKFTYAVNQLYGYLERLAWEDPAAADAQATETVEGFTTNADRTAAARAREALDQALTRWSTLSSPTWEYAWTRTDAADAGTSVTWRVHHAKGKTTVTSADASAETDRPDEASIDGTVATAIGVLARGGWVDVSVDETTGLDVLLAIDPSPAVKGDGYWIRIDYTDLAAKAAAAELEAAKARWTAAALPKYSYTWRYEGPSDAWAYTVRMKSGAATIKPGSGAPPVEGSFVSPLIADQFAMIGAVLDEGGRVNATYDKKYGFPTRIEMARTVDAGANGTVTITGFKAR